MFVLFFNSQQIERTCAQKGKLYKLIQRFTTFFWYINIGRFDM